MLVLFQTAVNNIIINDGVNAFNFKRFVLLFFYSSNCCLAASERYFLSCMQCTKDTS